MRSAACLAIVATMIWLLAVGCAASQRPQVRYGSIAGRVDGARTATVTVTPRLPNALDNSVRVTQTDERGEFHVPDVPAGAYAIEICAAELHHTRSEVHVAGLKTTQVFADPSQHDGGTCRPIGSLAQ